MPITVRLPFWSVGEQVYVTQEPGEGSHNNYTYQSWDFALGYSHRVRAIADGVVVDMRDTVPDGDASQMTQDDSWGSGAIGNMITLQHDIDGVRFYSSYFHLRSDKVPVEIGDNVIAGAEIGQVGYTGIRSGGHIHLQVSTELIWFGGTNYGWPDGSDNGEPQRVADARQSAANADLISFEGYGATLPGTVVGAQPTIFTPGDDVVQLATPGIFHAGQGADRVTGSSGADKVFGQAGQDVIRGKSGNDVLIGGAGKDILFGGHGKDVLKGGTGPDLLTGNAGADRFVFADNDGRDVIRDFQDNRDRLALSTKLWDDSALSIVQVVDQFAREKGDNIMFDFGDGQKLLLKNVTSADLLIDDILLF